MAKKLESSIENSFCKWLKRHYPDYIAIKLNLWGRRGLPDRLVLGANRFVLFIEFKRPGEDAEPLQVYYHKILKGFGFNVEVCDNAEDAKEKFCRYLRS